MKKSLCRFARLFPLPLLAASLLVASCSSDDSNSPNQQPDPEQPASRPIYVEVSENQMVNTAEARQMTRAAITELSTLTGFYMKDNINNENIYTVNKNNGKWTVTGSWPVADNSSVTFYAYNGGVVYNATSDPYISFTVDENVGSQQDLLVAKTATTFDANNGMVILTFDHACAALDFTIALSENAAAKEGTVVMKSATLYNVKNKGNYYYNANEGKGAWSELKAEGTVSYTLESTSGTSLSTTPHRLACNYIFMIPQTLTAWNKSDATDGTYIDVVLSVSGGGGDKTVRFPFPKELKAGDYYPIDIKIMAGAKDIAGNRIFPS